MTLGAHQIGAVARQQHPHVHAVAFALEPAKPAANALVFAVAFDDERFLLVGQFAPGFFGRNLFALAEIEQAARPARSIEPRLDGAVAQRFAGVGNHQIEIDVDNPAEAAAGFAGAERTIERKEIRHRIAIRDLAMRAMQMIAERLAAPIFLRQKEIQAALAVMKRLLERIHDAFFVRAAESEAIDDDLQGSVPAGGCGQFVELTDRLIDEQTVKTGLRKTVLHLVPSHRRTRQVETSSTIGEPSANVVELGIDGLGRIALDRTIAAAAVKHAQSSKRAA